ncbi:MAG TPA: copper resistance protein CopC, partial [Thermomicrobiales bacterium]|nr:copper resistance protein CopC [Thermomicrobiales bacterium]
MRTLRFRNGFLLLALLLSATAVVWMPQPVEAHASLASSDPPPNEIVSQSPGRVELTFSEGVEQTYTKVILVDQDNNPVAGTRLTFDEGNNRLVRMIIPDDLPRGTYSVVWRTLSADDGHRFSGYFAFTIGSTSDVRTVIPPTFNDSNGVPLWLAGVGRWLSFITLALLGGFWFAWLVVIRPALTPVWQIGPEVTRRVRRFALLAGLAFMLAALFLLALQAKGQLEGGYPHTISAILGDTRWGRFWLMRMVLGMAIVLLIPITAWWRPRRRLWTMFPLLALSALLPVPVSMVAHASAATYGRTAAIAFDYLHLLAISLWAGGLATLFVAVTGAGDLLPRGRRLFLAAAVPRFSWLAITSFAAIGATGFYAGYLQVGTWSGLTDTQYGRQLL